MITLLVNVYKYLVLDRPVVVLLVLAVLTLWIGSHVPQTRFDASSDSLVLEGDTDLAYSRAISARYGSEDFLLVTFRPEGDLYDSKVLAELGALKQELAGINTVSSVTSILDVPLLYSPPVDITDIGGALPTLSQPGVDRKLARKEFSNSPIYRDLLTNLDGTVTALQVNLRRDEHYFKLLEQRESLRELNRNGALAGDRLFELTAIEAQFRDYVLENSAREEKVVADVRQVLERYRADAEIFLGGVPMISVDMIHFAQNDLLKFGIAIVLFIVCMMGFIFRRVRWVVIPLTCCLVTVLLFTGTMALLDWRLTVLSSNVIAILLIVNLSILIYLVERYRELAELQPHSSQRELVWETLRSKAQPCLYSALTIVIAFGSLVVSGIRPVIDFGWMMTVGVSAALLLSFVVLPAMLMVTPREHVAKKAQSKPFTARFAVIAESHGTVLVLVSALLALLSVLGISRLQVENRFIDFFSPQTEIYTGMEIIDRELGGTIPLDIIIDADPAELAQLRQEATSSGGGFEDDFGGDYDEDFDASLSSDLRSEAVSHEDLATADVVADDSIAKDNIAATPLDAAASISEDTAVNVWFTRRGMQRISEVHQYLDSLPQVGKVISLATFYQVVEDLMDGNVDDVQLAIVNKNLPVSVREVLIDPYYSAENNQVRISLRAMETSRSLQRDELLKDIPAYLVNELGFKPEQIHLTGMLVLYNNMLQSLYTSQILTIGVVFLVIMAMFLVVYRSVSMTMVAITPNLLAAGIVLGGMGLAGIPLDMMTITIASICLGIGVDFTIHYLHRCQVEFAVDGDYVATIHRSHDSVGRPMHYTSVIIIFGFGILTLSNFTPSFYFGLLTGISMLVSLMGSLLLLPRLVLIFKPLGEPGHAVP